MASISNKQFTETSLWLRSLGEGLWEVGIADDWLAAFGELMYIEVTPVGTVIESGCRIALVESAKVVIELSLPAAVTITAVNQAVLDTPQLLASGGDDSWFARFSAGSLSDHLLDRDEYLARQKGKKR